jgi:hypothetical protein
MAIRKTDIRLEDAETWGIKVMPLGFEIIPGFAGSPALLPRTEALREFWNDKKFFDDMLFLESPVKATVLRVPIKRSGVRASSTTPPVRLVIACNDPGLSKCPECDFPMIEGTRCISCTWEAKEKKQ